MRRAAPHTGIDHVAPGPTYIAVVEDDNLRCEAVLLPQLTGLGFKVTLLRAASELEALLLLQQLDVVVFFSATSGADRSAGVRSLRGGHPHLGIVTLTPRDDEAAQVKTLLAGADASLANPADMSLLAATLHSVARRLQTPARHAPTCCAHALPGWRLDASGWRLLSPDGGSLPLTRSERPLVQRLLQQQGEVVRRDVLIAELTNDVWGFDPHRLESMIYRLRRKARSVCATALPLQAVHGEGYVFSN